MANEVLKLVIEGVDRFSGTLGGLRKQLEMNEKGLGNIAAMATNVATTALKMAAAVGAAATALGVLAVKAAADFELKLAEVSTLVSGVAEKDMPAVKNAILEMTRDIPKGVAELTEAQYQAQSAGFAVKDALELVGIAARGSVAGLTDTGTAMTGLTKALGAYGEGAKDASKYMDVMFTAVKTGQMRFGELSTEIGKVASTASSVGVPIEELTAMMSTLTLVGGDLAQETTHLRGAMAAFVKPSKEAETALAEFGIATKDATTGAMIPFQDILKQIVERKLTYNQILQILPEKEAADAVNKLVNAYSKYGDNLEAAMKAQGAMTGAYDKIAQSFNKQLTLVWNSVKALSIVIGDDLLGAVTDLIQFIKSGIDALIEWEQRTKTFEKFMVELRGEVKSVYAAIKETFTLPAVQEFVNMLSKAQGEMSAVKLIISGIREGLQALNAILGAAAVSVAFVYDQFKRLNWIMERVMKPWDWEPFPEATATKTLNMFADVHNALEKIGRMVAKPKLDPEPMKKSIEEVEEGVKKLQKEMSPGIDKAIKGATEEVKDKSKEMKRELEDALKIKLAVMDHEANIKVERMKLQAETLKTGMQLKVELDIEKAKIGLEMFRVQMDNLKETAKGITETISSIIQGMTSAGSQLQKWSLEDKLDRMLLAQERLVNAQISLIQERQRQMQLPVRREHIIRVIESDMTWVDGFIRFLLDKMKITIEEEGFECLCNI